MVMNASLYERFLLYDSKSSDADALHGLLNAETQPNLVRLFTSPVDEIEKLLHGVVSDTVSVKILKVRKALDKRVEKLVLGDDYEASERESTQIRRLRRGELLSVRLLHLINLDDSGTPTDPLAGFGKLHSARAPELFLTAIHRVRDVISVSSPSLAPVASRFLRELSEQLQHARGRGATWTDCSRYYCSLMKKVEADSKLFVAGGGNIRSLNFDMTLINDHSTKFARQLDEDIMDNKRSKLDGGKGKGRGRGGDEGRGRGRGRGRGKPLDESDIPKDDGDKDDPATKKGKEWGTYFPHKWQSNADLKKWFADARKEHGVEPTTKKIPCGFKYGAPNGCQGGKDGKPCSFWHGW